MIHPQLNVDLQSKTTFYLGGPARYFVSVNSPSQLAQAARFARTHHLPIFVLGEGSDILVDDRGLNALVVTLNNRSLKLDSNSHQLTAAAGVHWDDLVAFAVDHQLQGVECLSGIPGTVGASPIQNIGAYGQELADTLVSLSAYDLKQQTFVTFSAADCRFAYRDSIFKQPSHRQRFIIWEVTLTLHPNSPPTLTYRSLQDYLTAHDLAHPSLAQTRQAVLSLRAAKLDDPRLTPNAGSYFKNPLIDRRLFASLQSRFPDLPHTAIDSETVKLYAGWLIEQAGYKGKTYQDVAVSATNALVLTNPQRRGTSRQILELANLIITTIKDQFGLTLEPEVQYIKL